MDEAVRAHSVSGDDRQPVDYSSSGMGLSSEICAGRLRGRERRSPIKSETKDPYHGRTAKLEAMD